MGTSLKCKTCGKKIEYSPSKLELFGEHLLKKHHEHVVANFTLENNESQEFGGGDTYFKKFCRSSNKKRTSKSAMFKTTVETWKPGSSYIECLSCGRTGQPLVRKQRNKVAQSSLGALCLMGCWPLCFLPFILGGSNTMNLYCKYCGQFLGTFDRKSGRMQSSEENVPNNIEAQNSCECRN